MVEGDDIEAQEFSIRSGGWGWWDGWSGEIPGNGSSKDSQEIQERLGCLGDSSSLVLLSVYSFLIFNL